MEKKSHTIDSTGFDYMANTGQEEQDRDLCGMGLALIIMAILTSFQYLGLY